MVKGRINVFFIFRSASILVCVLAATYGWSQALPAIAPVLDPTFWGRAHAPYTVKLTVTTTSAIGKNPPQTHVSVANEYRDSTGRVCTEGFYDNGRPMTVTVRDPGTNTFTGMKVFNKTFFVMPVLPPSGKGWAAERLPSRVIAGFPAEGLRFTRTIPASADGNRPADTVIEEEWISSTLYLVLERKTESPLTGTRTETVSQFKQVEPDPALFKIPSDYTSEQATSAAK